MSKEVINSTHFSKRFLEMLGAPENTRALTFACTAGGLLRCTAQHYMTDNIEYLESKTWDVQLCRTSPFYKLITGEL